MASGKFDIEIELTGSRCQKKCALGPNIIVNDKAYNNVTENDLGRFF